MRATSNPQPRPDSNLDVHIGSRGGCSGACIGRVSSYWTPLRARRRSDPIYLRYHFLCSCEVLWQFARGPPKLRRILASHSYMVVRTIVRSAMCLKIASAAQIWAGQTEHQQMVQMTNEFDFINLLQVLPSPHSMCVASHGDCRSDSPRGTQHVDAHITRYLLLRPTAHRPLTSKKRQGVCDATA